jgi:hypothetical protein
MYAVLCCCCCRRLPCSTTFHAINNHRCLLLALTGTRTVVLAIHCHCHIITITTTTSIVPTTPCPPAQSRLPSSSAADDSTPLACDAMQCFVPTINPMLVLVVVPCDVNVSMVLQPSCWFCCCCCCCCWLMIRLVASLHLCFSL